MSVPVITCTRLSSGYWHVRGVGPVNWTQPPQWPSSDLAYLRAHAHPEAGEAFLYAAAALGRELEMTHG